MTGWHNFAAQFPEKYFIFAIMDSAIIQRINTLLIDEFELDESQVSTDANLKNTLDLDSLDYIDLIALTEANFGCKIPPEDFLNIITFNDLYTYIDTHARQQATV